MAIQIPTIQRNAPLAPTDTVQTNIGRGVDVAQGDGITKGLTAVAGDVEDRIQFEAQQHADTVSTDYTSQYQQWYDTTSKSLKMNQGDPTPLYADFDQKAQVKQADLLGQAQANGYDDRTMTAIQQKLTRSNAELYSKRSTDEAQQNLAYQKNVNTSALSDQYQGVMDTARNLNVKDPTTFKSFNTQLQEVENLTVSQADKEGLMKRDTDGSYMTDEDGNYNPIVEARIQQNKSAALRPVIAALNATGNLDAAKQILVDHGDDLTPKDYAAAVKMGAEVGVNQQANVMYSKMQNLPPDQLTKQIAAIQDPRLREKVGSLQSTDVRQKSFRDDQTSKMNYNNMLGDAQAAAAQGTTWGAFQQQNKNYITLRSQTGAAGNPLLNDKYDSKLKKIFNPPNDSDPDSIKFMQDARSDGSLGTMSNDDYQTFRSDLSKKDQSTYDRLRFNMQDPKSSQNVAGLNYAADTGLKDAAARAGLIKVNPITGSFKNQKEEYKFRDLQNQFVQDNQGMNIGNDHMKARDAANTWVANKHSSGTFSGGAPSTGNSVSNFVGSLFSKSNTAAPPPTAVSAYSQMTMPDRAAAMQKWNQKNSTPFRTSDFKSPEEAQAALANFAKQNQ